MVLNLVPLHIQGGGEWVESLWAPVAYYIIRQGDKGEGWQGWTGVVGGKVRWLMW